MKKEECQMATNKQIEDAWNNAHKIRGKNPENKTLHYIQRNLEKLDEQKLKQAEKILQTVFDDIFEDGDDEDDDI